jgi:hypothetical protein
MVSQLYFALRFFSNENEPFNVKERIQKDPHFCLKTIVSVVLEISNEPIQSFTGHQLMAIESMRIKGSGHQSTDGTTLIHIPMYFTLKDCAMPLIALPYSPVKITIQTVDLIPNVSVKPQIVLTHIHLDEPERTMFHDEEEGLKLKVLLHGTSEMFRGVDGIFRIPLHFNGLINAIYFTLHKDESIDSMFQPLVGKILEYELLLNGVTRAVGNEETAFLDRIDSKIQKDSPVYVIPFANEPLNPTTMSNTLNLSGIHYSELNVRAKKEATCIRVWSDHWNIFHTRGGFLAKSFSN